MYRSRLAFRLEDIPRTSRDYPLGCFPMGRLCLALSDSLITGIPLMNTISTLVVNHLNLASWSQLALSVRTEGFTCNEHCSLLLIPFKGGELRWEVTFYPRGGSF